MDGGYGHCAARADLANTQWTFCPSEPAAILFTVLFAAVMLAHLAQGIFYKKWYSAVMVMSAGIQMLDYIFRIVSIKMPNSEGPYAVWFALILFAPLFTNAFVYMCFGRMVWNYIPEAKIHGITAWRFSTYFVLSDIICLVIQVAGASSAAGNNHPDQEVLNAIHIYMGGVALQQFFILIFLFFAVQFHRHILQQMRNGVEDRSRALQLLYAIYAVLVLITVRIIFRLVEYASGFKSNVPEHEAFQYCLDSVPMLIAILILNVFHPGRIMPGNENDLPSRKERKVGGIRTKSEKVNGGADLSV